MTGLQTGIVACVWAGSLGAAFFAGMKLEAPSTDRGEAVIVDAPSPARPADFQVRSTQGSTDEAAESGASAMEPAGAGGGAGFTDRLAQALSEPDQVRRSGMLAALLENLSPENLAEALATFEEGGMDWQRASEIQMLLHAWARFDPQGAIEYAYEKMDGRRGAFMAGGVVREWAGRDFNAAYSWAQSLDGQNQMMAMAAILGAKAERDPAEAARLAGSLQGDGRGLDWIFRSIAEEYGKSNPQAAMNWAASITDDGRKRDAIRRVAEEWVGADPAGAAAWARSNPNSDQAVSIARQYAAHVASTSPSQALDWVRSLPEGDARNRSMAAVISRWAETDPNSAGTHLNSLPRNAATDVAIETFARRVAADDPVASLTWAMTIQDENIRNRTLIEIGRWAHEEDPAGAAQWAEANQISEEVKNAITTGRGGRRGRPPWAGLD